jgi:transglutaminase-like putative cysteine protease
VKIRVGYDMIYDVPQPTPMIMVLGVHFTRASDVIVPDYLTTNPSVAIAPYRDGFGNWCSRIVAPGGVREATNSRSLTTAPAFQKDSIQRSRKVSG